MKLKIGTKVRFTKEIIQLANCDHPECLLASIGAIGVIVAIKTYNCIDSYSVKLDGSSNPFLCYKNEFEVIP